MEKNMKPLLFEAKDLFEEIPGDPDNVLLKLPPELIRSTRWKDGDILDINLEDGAIHIVKLNEKLSED